LSIAIVSSLTSLRDEMRASPLFSVIWIKESIVVGHVTVSGVGLCRVIASYARAAGPPVVASVSRSAACASRSTIGSSSAWPWVFLGLGFADGLAFGFAADGLATGVFLAGVFGTGLLAFFICSTPHASGAALPESGGF
jgi:hypothetical protein